MSMNTKMKKGFKKPSYKLDSISYINTLCRWDIHGALRLRQVCRPRVHRVPQEGLLQRQVPRGRLAEARRHLPPDQCPPKTEKGEEETEEARETAASTVDVPHGPVPVREDGRLGVLRVWTAGVLLGGVSAERLGPAPPDMQ